MTEERSVWFPRASPWIGLESGNGRLSGKPLVTKATRLEIAGPVKRRVKWLHVARECVGTCVSAASVTRP